MVLKPDTYDATFSHLTIWSAFLSLSFGEVCFNRDSFYIDGIELIGVK